MNTKLIIATARGIQIAQEDGSTWKKTHNDLIQHAFTAAARQGHSILAGASDGLFVSLNDGQSWQAVEDGLSHPHIRALQFLPDDAGVALAGTEPASIFRSRDGGLSWQECPEVAQLRDKYNWSLPYSPRAGCIRDFAVHGQRAYAAVEQGGLLRSDDNGRSWHLMDPEENESLVASHQPWIHPDVHSVHIHPSSADQVFAPTGGGLYYSTSGGRSWSHLHPHYCRAIWVDPNRPATMILGSADGPDRNGRIEVSRNGGDTWDLAMDGLEIGWPNNMVEQFLQIDNQLLAVLSNGALISTTLDTLEWRSIRAPLTNVRAVSD
jgi:photosystem II stability/assembly factor-like uncharacterized protein